MATTELLSKTVARGSLGSFAERDADCTVVWLRGDHDLSTVDELSETMARAIALDDSDVVVDLSEVQFMSAATVRVIVRAQEFLRLESRSFALRSPSRSAGRILVLCGLDELVGLQPADPMRIRTSGALATWVAVPPAPPVERPADAHADHRAAKRRSDSGHRRGP